MESFLSHLFHLVVDDFHECRGGCEKQLVRSKAARVENVPFGRVFFFFRLRFPCLLGWVLALLSFHRRLVGLVFGGWHEHLGL